MLTDSPAMDVSSPPNNSEIKNVEMADVSQGHPAAEQSRNSLTEVSAQPTGILLLNSIFRYVLIVSSMMVWKSFKHYIFKFTFQKCLI